MILTCPECSAKYIVDPKALLPNGRMVRCAKCKYSWKEAAPSKDTPTVADAEADGPKTESPVKESPKEPVAQPEEEAVPETPAEDFAINRTRRKKRPRPMPKGSNLPALQNHRHGNMMWGWYSLAAFIIIIVSSFLIFQSSISHIWPPSSKLYALLGMDDNGLDHTSQKEHGPEPKIPLDKQFKIEDTLPSKFTNGDVVTLKIEGNIANLTDRTLPLPLLKIFLRNARGETLREWTFKPAAATISKEEKVPFSTSLPNPPENATSISVILAENK